MMDLRKGGNVGIKLDCFINISDTQLQSLRTPASRESHFEFLQELFYLVEVPGYRNMHVVNVWLRQGSSSYNYLGVFWK